MFCLYIEGSSEWCCNFVTQNGLNIYTSLINSFETNNDILIKSTGLIVISLYYMNRFKSPFFWFDCNSHLLGFFLNFLKYKLSEIAQIRPILFNHPIMNSIK